MKPCRGSNQGVYRRQARRESIERMVDRVKAHGANVATSFKLNSNGDYNHCVWHDGIRKA